ncbi:MAG: hypothetical protein ABI113_04440, partial [Mucilaginibacter sp.]
MIRITFLFLLLSALVSAALGQQQAHRDSLVRAARADAKNFRLDDAVWKKYKHTLPNSSDYFKPREADVKSTALLTDSVYVDAYRQAAFKSNKHRHTIWHFVLVGGSIAAGVVVLAI